MPVGRVGSACSLVVAMCLAPLTVEATAHADLAEPARPVPGVLISRMRMAGPVRAVVVRIDLAIVNIDVVPARTSAPGSTTLRRLSERHEALVAVNGDLSNEGWPAHLLMHDGRLLTSGDERGGAFAFDATGTRGSVVIDRVPITLERLDTEERVSVGRWNGGEAPGRRLGIFSARTAPPTDHPGICSALLRPAGGVNRFRVGSSGCGLTPDSQRTDVVAIAPRASHPGRWLRRLTSGVRIGVRVHTGLPTVSEAFGGSPVLVHRGRVVSQRCGPLPCELHPRTAAGLTRGCLDDAETACRLLLVVVDGRRSGWSTGMTTKQLSHLMLRVGAVEAINFDGGASSQLLVRGQTMSRVAPGARRAVVSAIIVRHVFSVTHPRTPNTDLARAH